MQHEKYDKNTLGYVPIEQECVELGFCKTVEGYLYAMCSQYDDPEVYWHVQHQVERWVAANDMRILKEQSERLESLRLKASIKKERDVSKELSHWYNTLPKDIVLRLIEDSKKYCDKYIDRSQLSESLERKKEYNERLRERVKTYDVVYRDTLGKNVSRFPRYDSVNNCLVGSSFSFVTLWSHVFPAKK